MYLKILLGISILFLELNLQASWLPSRKPAMQKIPDLESPTVASSLTTNEKTCKKYWPQFINFLMAGSAGTSSLLAITSFVLHHYNHPISEIDEFNQSVTYSNSGFNLLQTAGMALGMKYSFHFEDISKREVALTIASSAFVSALSFAGGTILLFNKENYDENKQITSLAVVLTGNILQLYLAQRYGKMCMRELFGNDA